MPHIFFVNEFIVQSSNMEKAIRNWYGKKIKVKIVPFAYTQSCQLSNNRQGFVYVASGEEHKNHFRLLQAWSLLGKQGLKLKLILTIGSSFKTLVSKINFLRNNNNLLFGPPQIMCNSNRDIVIKIYKTYVDLESPLEEYLKQYCYDMFSHNFKNNKLN